MKTNATPLPFEQQPKESNKAFTAFTIYLSLGDRRSTRVVAERLSRSDQLIRRWSAKWDWMEHVRAYAAHLATVEREACEALVRSNAARWLQRQQQIRERDWTLHEKATAACERSLNKFTERDDAEVTLSDIARLLEVASKLGRMACGLPTDKTELTGEDGGPLRVEVCAALDKIYGPAVDVECQLVKPALPPAPEVPAGECEREPQPPGGEPCPRGSSIWRPRARPGVRASRWSVSPGRTWCCSRGRS